jgi:hypothetical protein
MRPMTRYLLPLVFVGAMAATAGGNGKFFVGEQVPAGVPYQRAILLFHEGRETLVLQSEYDLPPSAAIDSLGWVVPVPAIPEIAGADARIGEVCFLTASRQTQPDVFHVSILFPFVPLALLLCGFVLLAVCLLRYPSARRDESSRAAWARQTKTIGTIVAFAFLAIGIWMPSLLRFPAAAGGDGVDIVKTEQAGIYNVTVIRGRSAEAIMEWLSENRFHFNDADRQVFQGYVDRGWCFVAARVRPNPEVQEEAIGSEGMAAPLILEFAAERPVYPLALTAAAGTDTEVLIYTLSDTKLTSGGRLPLRHARQTRTHNVLSSLLNQAELEDWPVLRDLPNMPMVLCKFKGRLTPAQMREDLEFAAAPDNEAYRERRIVW